MNLNHTLLRLFLLVLLVNWQYSYCQTEAPVNPSASSITQYAESPVDFYTGVPNISVPIYSIPTRTEELNVPIIFNYHALSVAQPYEKMGNVGRGWSINPGAEITREIIDLPDELRFENPNLMLDRPDVYTFSIMGRTGSFIVQKSGTFVSTLLKENKGWLFSVDVDFNSTTNTINKFYITDDKGNKYEFGLPDSFIYVTTINQDPPNPVNPRRLTLPSVFHLINVYDKKNNPLVHYDYVTYNVHEGYHKSGEYNYTRFLAGLTVYGFGNVTLTYLGGVDNFRYTKVSIYDEEGELIKRCNLSYYSTPTTQTLNQLSIDAGLGTDVQNYSFSYKPAFIGAHQTLEEDTWGFNKLIFSRCSNRGEGGESATGAVLQKINLPTGGAVVYDFESNTYSYNKDKPLDSFYDSNTDQTSVDPYFFTRLSAGPGGGFNYRNNVHNYTATSIADFTFNQTLGGSQNFFASGDVYIKLYAESYTVPGSTFTASPSFTLKKGGITVQNFSPINDYFVDEGFLCLGKKLNLGFPSATYTISMGSSNLTQGTASIYRLAALPSNQVKKWWYGGGIRIKSISYYEDADDLSQASRVIAYNYNMFDNPNRSSGSLLTDYKKINEFKKNLIGYNNVTVTDSKTGGRTEYDYYSPLDNIDLTSLEIGKPQMIRIYDDNNVLLKSTEFEYTDDILFIPGETEGSEIGVIGWVDVSKIVNKYHSPEGVVQTTDDYLYHGHKNVYKHIRTSATQGETLVTEYSYHYAGAGGLYLPELVETYRNGDLITKAGSTYYNTSETDLNGQTYTASYRLKDVQAAKGNNSLETISTITKYDDYNHVLETRKYGGLVTSYIWGYNNTRIIAKIEGIAYNSISASLITAAQNASDVNMSNLGAENNLLTALNNIRNSSAVVSANAMVTTYTYKSAMIGVSTVTDTRCRLVRYIYDENNRLMQVQDQEGNILTENEYHTQP